MLNTPVDTLLHKQYNSSKKGPVKGGGECIKKININNAPNNRCALHFILRTVRERLSRVATASLRPRHLQRGLIDRGLKYPVRKTMSVEQRKKEILAKKAKLAELKRTRELREREKSQRESLGLGAAEVYYFLTSVMTAC